MSRCLSAAHLGPRRSTANPFLNICRPSKWRYHFSSILFSEIQCDWFPLLSCCPSVARLGPRQSMANPFLNICRPSKWRSHFSSILFSDPIIELLPVGGPSRALTVHGQSIFEYLLAIAVAISFFHKLYILRKKMRLVVNGRPLSSGCPSVAGRWPVSGPSRPRRLDGMMDSGLAEITLIIVAINYLHCNSVKCTNYHLHLNRFQGFVRGKPSLVCIIFPSHDWFAL